MSQHNHPMHRHRTSTLSCLRLSGICLLIAASVGALVGCAGSGVKSDAQAHQMHWPALPDQPRFVFEATLGTESNILAEDESKRLRRAITGVKANNRPVIDKPSGLAVFEHRVYITEPSVKAVTVMDGSRHRLFRMGTRAPNNLELPQAVAIDAEGLVYVLDPKLQKVMVFDPLGLFKFSIALEGKFSNPVGLAVDANGQSIYVVDRGMLENDDHKVVAFSPDGKEKFRLGPRGHEDGKFNIPLAAVVAPDGTLLVADSGNAKIQAFDATGKFKFSFGGFGAELGRFSRPRSIATDRDGNIYVADAGFNNVQIFNAKGELLMPMGKLSQDNSPGNYALIGAIAVDESNRLFVTDNFFKRIDVFRQLSDAQGQALLAKGN